MTLSPRWCASRTKVLEIPEGAVVGVHSLVVGDIVATVLERGWVVRQEPDRRDAEVLEVVELLRQSGEIADPSPLLS
jgi:hypothetical protein